RAKIRPSAHPHARFGRPDALHPDCGRAQSDDERIMKPMRRTLTVRDPTLAPREKGSAERALQWARCATHHPAGSRRDVDIVGRLQGSEARAEYRAPDPT